MEPAGLDPYDALRGTRLPRFVRRQARLRQAVVQMRKRTPLDLAPLLGVKPFVMAKALACLMTGRTRSWVARSRQRSDGLAAEVAALADSLQRCQGHVGAGAWAYEFDVQTRWAFYPAGSPNTIASVFVGRGFLEAGLAFDRADWLDEAAAVAERLARDCLVEGPEGPFFAYTAHSPRLIHNANLLAAGLIAAWGRFAGDSGALRLAVEACGTSLRAQTQDGALPYGDAPDLGWRDNYHTAYALDGLEWVRLASREPVLGDAISAGARFWISHFFGKRGEPYFYSDRRHPYDIHCAATAVDVGVRSLSFGLEMRKLCERVFDWAGSNMIDPKTGDTYFQRWPYWTDRRHFVRWGDAHWAMASGAVESMRTGVGTSVENMLQERGRGSE